MSDPNAKYSVCELFLKSYDILFIGYNKTRFVLNICLMFLFPTYADRLSLLLAIYLLQCVLSLWYLGMISGAFRRNTSYVKIVSTLLRINVYRQEEILRVFGILLTDIEGAARAGNQIS